MAGRLLENAVMSEYAVGYEQCKYCGTTTGIVYPRKSEFRACDFCLLQRCQRYEAALQQIAGEPQDEPAIDWDDKDWHGLTCGLASRSVEDGSVYVDAAHYGFDHGVERALERSRGVAQEALERVSTEPVL